MTKKKRSILMSVLTLMLCLALVAGGTYALFTDSATIQNHLQAGTLDVKLTRVELVKTTLDGKGFLVKGDPNTERVDFSEKINRNLFDITNTEKIVPGTKYEAKLELKNESDVAFGFWIDVVCTDKTKGEDLAKQLKVTVLSDEHYAYVGDGLTVKGDSSDYIDVLAIGDTVTFTVIVEFVDSHVDNTIGPNDLAQGEEIHFDLIVSAVQVTKEPTNP